MKLRTPYSCRILTGTMIAAVLIIQPVLRAHTPQELLSLYNAAKSLCEQKLAATNNLASSVTALQSQLDQAIQNRNSVADEIGGLYTTINDLEMELADALLQSQTQEEFVQAYQDIIDNLEAQIDNIKSDTDIQINRIEGQIEDYSNGEDQACDPDTEYPNEGEIEALQQEIEELEETCKARIKPYQDEIEEITVYRDMAQRAVDEANSGTEEIQSAIDACYDEISSLNETLNGLAISTIENNLNAARQQYETILGEYQAACEYRDGLKRQIEDMGGNPN